MKRFLLFFLALPLFALAEGGLPTEPYIYVQGKAEIEKPADLVTLRFELSAVNPDQSLANRQVQSQTKEILNLLKSIKTADRDIIASDLRSEAQYQDSDDPAQRHTFTGYKVSRPFTVKVRNLAGFPKLVDDLLALKVEAFDGIEEGLSNEKELQDQVWAKAMADARERAEKTLQAAGMRIDTTFAISPVAFPEIRSQIFGSGHENGAVSTYDVAAAPAKPDLSQYRLSPVTVSQSIHVIYLIAPVK